MDESAAKKAGQSSAPADWQLRRAQPADAAALHLLAGKPAVYRFLFDGIAPDLDQITVWLEESLVYSEHPGLGLWILARSGRPCVGAVRLHPLPRSTTAELSYLLAPEVWWRGLASRMSWTVIGEAFDRGGIDSILAGADLPNSASLAVMRRLGMRFLRETRYPLGPGVEYLLRRSDPPPRPPIEPLTLL